MAVIFGSIVLNEQQYIAANLQQHLPFCDKWIIVEGADRDYPNTKVSTKGLSRDKTAKIIQEFPDPHGKIEFIQHGWAKNKMELRNRYAEKCSAGDLVIIFDADEFLTAADLKWLIAELSGFTGPGALRLPHVHFWKNSNQIITGGYYSIPHHRCYVWDDNCMYRDNHNHPAYPGKLLHDRHTLKFERKLVDANGRPVRSVSVPVMHKLPTWLHYGFCKTTQSIQDKNAYYIARGEAVTRPDTTRDRAAYFQDGVPDGCVIYPWIGSHPEVFRECNAHLLPA